MVHSVYIHIPFCDSICSYCDFCKFLKNDEWVKKYLDSLEMEIQEKYKNEEINTLYIGGGTPSSLNIRELEKLFSIIKKFKLSLEYEFTFECNIENINYNKLKFLYDHGVNRLSIGVETFNEKFLNFLNRHHKSEDVFKIIEEAKKIGFKNINIDLMYALPDETLEDLKNDLDNFLKLDINHLSIYSLIIEEHTKLYNMKINNIDEDLDLDMYNLIINTLSKNGYKHYEISNFARDGYESKHNLVYWHNDHYYGFGLGASGYIDNIRYENTRSLNNYFKANYVIDEHVLSLDEVISNEFILGFRMMKGINKKEFFNKYKIDILTNESVKKLIKEDKIIDDNEYIFINPKYIYTSNNILVEFI